MVANNKQIDDADDRLLAAASQRVLARRTGKKLPLRLKMVGGKDVVTLPARAVKLLDAILGHLAAGDTVDVVSLDDELTTQQAADLLGVSRPFLVAQLDDDALPCRRVGSHRRVRRHDVIAYKKRMAARREKVLGELAREAQKLDMGY